MKSKDFIGRAETILLPEITSEQVFARIDTGARTSAIWASEAVVEDARLAVIFFGPEHKSYTGEKVYFEDFSRDMVTSSTGHSELRYMVKLRVEVKGRKVRANFTLADRSKQTYPVLVGRNVLRGKFIVDVTLGVFDPEGEKILNQKKRKALEEDK